MDFGKVMNNLLELNQYHTLFEWLSESIFASFSQSEEADLLRYVPNAGLCLSINHITPNLFTSMMLPHCLLLLLGSVPNPYQGLFKFGECLYNTWFILLTFHNFIITPMP